MKVSAGRAVVGALLAAAAVATATLLGSGTSSAAVGSYFYDNKDPSATGCNNDAYTARSATLGDGAQILLRYSPSCRTVWAHIEGASAASPGDSAGGSALIYRENDGAGLRCNTGSGHSCVTNMLYDGGLSSHATGTDDTGFTIYRATTGSF